jgi:hypothetical protein
MDIHKPKPIRNWRDFLKEVGIIVIGVLAVTALDAQALPEKCEVCGTWIMVDRIDRAITGTIISEPTLGQHPSGILFYDRAGNVSVQLMKPDRKPGKGVPETLAGTNNTGTGNGYDAYFGKYKIDYAKHTVTHMLKGSILPGDVGKSVTRAFRLEGDELILSFDTENSGVQVRRSLRWRRPAQPQ